MKRLSSLIFCLIFFAALFALPVKPVPAKLVNDYANMLTQQQVNELENNLRDFSNSTTTQIVVITVDSLEGYPPSMYAQQIGESWKVGTKEFDNGIVILIKPKTVYSKGEAFIATGYGLEAVIPDAICKRIVENEMIPKFKQNDYYGGIVAAVNILKSLSNKEFSAKDYIKKTDKKGKGTGFIIVLIIFIFLVSGGFSSTNRARRSNMGSNNLPLWILLSMMGSGNSRHSGSFGNFKSGGGMFGGGGSSFGGFGGGSFGGGGAGGSW